MDISNDNFTVEDNILFNYHKLLEDLSEKEEILKIIPFDF